MPFLIIGIALIPFMYLGLGKYFFMIQDPEITAQLTTISEDGSSSRQLVFSLAPYWRSRIFFQMDISII
jgi:hypothetical protein